MSKQGNVDFVQFQMLFQLYRIYNAERARSHFDRVTLQVELVSS